MFPYGSVDLAHLEGFNPTSYEHAIAGNPGFICLRRRGFLNLGAVAIGRDESYADTTPSAVAKLLDRSTGILMSAVVCAAKVRRDIVADPVAMADMRNTRLLTDLWKWLNEAPTDYGTDRFRWEEYRAALQQQERPFKIECVKTLIMLSCTR